MSKVMCKKCNKGFDFNDSDGHVICDDAYCDDCVTNDKVLSAHVIMYNALDKIWAEMPNGDMPKSLSECYNDMHDIAREALNKIKESVGNK